MKYVRLVTIILFILIALLVIQSNTSQKVNSATNIGPECPASTQNCVPCIMGEQYCRAEEGETTGYLGWSCQNNNPGNIRYSESRNNLIVGQGGTAACGERGTFMVFKDYQTGRNGLAAYIKAINAGQHSAYSECGNCNLIYFFERYAPSSDNNNPNAYANYVAGELGIDVNITMLSWIVNNKLEEMVDAIQTHEGWFTNGCSPETCTDADFSASPRRGNIPLEVTFADTSTNSPSQWLWKFGDGTSSTTQNPVKTYTSYGKYSIILRATNTNSTDVKEKLDYVIATPWSSWASIGFDSLVPMAMQEFEGKFYQAIVEKASPFRIFMRSTSDGTFDGSSASENWSPAVNGKTNTAMSLAVFNNKLYITVRGLSGKVFTKAMNTEGVWDTTWNENGGATSEQINMASFDNRLFQIVKGNTTNNIFIRSTSDGIFNNSEASETWVQISGRTANPIALEVFNSRIYMSVRGESGEIFTRSSADGVFDNESDELFAQNGGMTTLNPALKAFNGKLYQAVKGNTTNYIFTRNTSDGSTWSNWLELEGSTTSPVTMGTFSGTNLLYQSVIGNSGAVFIRSTEGF